MAARWSILAGLVFACAACGGVARADDAPLRVATFAAIETFDPDLADDAAGVAARDAVYDGLVGYAPDSSRIVGRLAARWSVAPDGLTYSFTLRSGVTFHDGTAVTSADVLASLRRRLAIGGVLAARLDGVASLEAPDPGTFVMHLNRKLPWLLDVLAGAWGPKVMSAAVLAAHDGGDAARTWLRSHDAGSGPFRLASLRVGFARLERAPGYWGTAPEFAAVEIAMVPDRAAQALRLRAGLLDAVANAYPAQALQHLPPRFAASILPSFSLIVADINPLGRLADDEPRRAALAALNPKYWLSMAFRNRANIPNTTFPAAMLESFDSVDMPDDIVVARKTVERLHNVELTIGYKAGQADLLATPVELMLANLRAIGFDASAASLPDREPAAFAAHPTAAPDVLLVCADPGEATPQASARMLYVGDAPGNVFGLIDPTARRLARQAEGQDNRVATLKQYQLLSQRLVAAGGFVPLAEVPGIVVHRRDLTGFATHAGYPPGAFDYAIVSRVN